MGGVGADGGQPQQVLAGRVVDVGEPGGVFADADEHEAGVGAVDEAVGAVR
ncbi:MAG: hypothetical protein ACK559_02010 [bacterium]